MFSSDKCPEIELLDLMVVTCYHMIQQKLLIYLIGGATLALISIIPNTAFIACVILFLLTILEFAVAVLASPMPQQVKNPPAMRETQVTRVRFLGREDPWRGKKQLTLVFLPKKPRRQKILVGHILEGHKESNVPEHTQHNAIMQACQPPAYKPLLTQ